MWWSQQNQSFLLWDWNRFQMLNIIIHLLIRKHCSGRKFSFGLLEITIYTRQVFSTHKRRIIERGFIFVSTKTIHKWSIPPFLSFYFPFFQTRVFRCCKLLLIQLTASKAINDWINFYNKESTDDRYNIDRKKQSIKNYLGIHNDKVKSKIS